MENYFIVPAIQLTWLPSRGRAIPLAIQGLKIKINPLYWQLYAKQII
jgi:hypothetical protein